MKRTSLAVLLLAVLLALTACGKKEDAALERIVYVPEKLPVSAPLQHISSGCISGDTIFLLGNLQQDPEDADPSLLYGPWGLLELSPEGGRAQQLEAFQSAQFPEPAEAETISAHIRPGGDGTLWVTERVQLQTYDLPEGFDPEKDRKIDYISFRGESLVLRQLDREGNELFRFDSGDLAERLEVETLLDLWRDSDGDLLVNAGNLVAVLDSQGKPQYTLKKSELLTARDMEFIRLSDGRAAILAGSMGADGTQTPCLLTIDKEEQAWDTLCPLPPQTLRVFDGDKDALFYYIIGDKLFAWPAGTAEAEEARQVLSWADSGITANNISFFAFQEDGELTAMALDNMGRMPESKLYRLTATDAADAPVRTVVTYGTTALLPGEQQAIADFNEESTDCYISVIEYNRGTYEENLTAMITDILAGNMPDIIRSEDLADRMGAAGLLEDLWPYIDNDPELGRDSLMLRPLQSMEQAGKLYRIAESFAFETLVGARDIVGDRMSWTPEEFWAALETMPEGCAPLGNGGTRTEMLRTMVDLNTGTLLDWEAGTCRFDSQEFRELLEFCAAFPAEQTWTFEEIEVLNGNQMLLQSNLASFDYLKQYETLFGGDFSFVGYPNRQGRPGSRFNMYWTYAISASSPNKEAAWSYLRTKLTPHVFELEEGNFTHFPINKEDFQRVAELSMTPQMEEDRDGVIREVPRWRSGITSGDVRVGFLYDHITQEQYDQLMALYEVTEGTNQRDYSVLDIVAEAAGAYFAGDKSLDDTAREIQSRVSLYVNEQK